MVSAPWTPTDFSPAAAFACRTALSMPSVTKCTVESGRGHPAGTWWVRTYAGPHAWFPPPPRGAWEVRGPVRPAPGLGVEAGRCSGLGWDPLKVMGAHPPV